MIKPAPLSKFYPAFRTTLALFPFRRNNGPTECQFPETLPVFHK